MVNPQTSPNFGNGETGGDNSWTPPVYGTTGDGRPVTVSFGQGGEGARSLRSARRVLRGLRQVQRLTANCPEQDLKLLIYPDIIIFNKGICYERQIISPN